MPFRSRFNGIIELQLKKKKYFQANILVLDFINPHGRGTLYLAKKTLSRWNGFYVWRGIRTHPSYEVVVFLFNLMIKYNLSTMTRHLNREPGVGNQNNIGKLAYNAHVKYN